MPGCPPGGPGLLAAFGAGAFIGVTVAGRVGGRTRTGSRAGDGRLRRILAPGPGLALWALPVGWAVLALVSTHPAALFVGAVVQGGLSFGIGSTLVNRVLRVASNAPTLSGSFATVALNTGAVLGPLLAGAATGATGDYRGAVWISVGLAATGAAVMVVGRLRAPRDSSPLP